MCNNQSKFLQWKVQESRSINLIVFEQWCEKCRYYLDNKLLANTGTYTRTKGQECCILIWIIQNKGALFKICCLFCSPKTVSERSIAGFANFNFRCYVKFICMLWLFTFPIPTMKSKGKISHSQPFPIPTTKSVKVRLAIANLDSTQESISMQTMFICF